jgi:hypothetical protein
MKWHLKNRRGRTIASGTLKQMVTYLQHMVPDGEYQLVGSDVSVPTRRYLGQVIYPVGLEEFVSSLPGQHPGGE